MGRYFNDDELYHYGVLGMKWGVRRYQNADGSYTKAGLRRYNASMDIYEATKRKRDAYKAATNIIAGAGAVSVIGAGVSIYNKHKDRNLRAYYSHTSDY